MEPNNMQKYLKKLSLLAFSIILKSTYVFGVDKTSESTPINQLPPVLFKKIFSEVITNEKEIKELSSVCKKWNNIFYDAQTRKIKFLGEKWLPNRLKKTATVDKALEKIEDSRKYSFILELFGIKNEELSNFLATHGGIQNTLHEMMKTGNKNISLQSSQDILKLLKYCQYLTVKTENDKVRYIGEISGNRYHGLGIEFSAYWGIYIGEFHYGSYSGFGKHLCQNGDIYEGDFLDGLAHGNGKVILSDGTTYQGYFAYGQNLGPNFGLDWCLVL
jgi:hypothetical protein